jgi:hypothetical protein
MLQSARWRILAKFSAISYSIRYSRMANTYMKRQINRQIALKPQDVVVLLKLSFPGERDKHTYSELGAELYLSASEVHASIRRATAARLITDAPLGESNPIRLALSEFLVHGVPYAFPASFGSFTRGMPTSFAGPGFHGLIAESNEPPPVWPHSTGTVRGLALYPLYPTVPNAAQRDSRLYEALSLVDALRAGAARERDVASSALVKLLS